MNQHIHAFHAGDTEQFDEVIEKLRADQYDLLEELRRFWMARDNNESKIHVAKLVDLMIDTAPNGYAKILVKLTVLGLCHLQLDTADDIRREIREAGEQEGGST